MQVLKRSLRAVTAGKTSRLQSLNLVQQNSFGTGSYFCYRPSYHALGLAGLPLQEGIGGGHDALDFGQQLQVVERAIVHHLGHQELRVILQAPLELVDILQKSETSH